MANIITLGGLSPLTRTHIGILAGSKTYKPYPYLDIFKQAPILPTTNAAYIEFDVMEDRVTTAELVERGKGKGTEKAREAGFKRHTVVPGEIYVDQSLTANELLQMQPGQPQVMVIGGVPVTTAEQVSQRKIQRLRESLDNRKNIMCTQALNDGIVVGKGNSILWNNNLQPARTATYSAVSGFLKLVRTINEQYIKSNDGMPADKFLIGSDIADAILKDAALQQTMYYLNMSNIGRDLTANEKTRVIGTFMGQVVQEMGYSFNENGVSIIGGNQVKLINTGMLAQGYAAIEVQLASGLPGFYVGDEYIDIQEGTKKNPTASIFAKSGFMPIITDPISVQTWTVTIA
jgi:hypothetical protein